MYWVPSGPPRPSPFPLQGFAAGYHQSGSQHVRAEDSQGILG